jgi:transcriptional regulator with PAS, ATPase and Fis domain
MALERSPRQLVRMLEGEAFPLSVLSAVRELRTYLDKVERDALLRAREFGASPTDIATALGITRQGVYHKLQRLASAPKPSEEPEPEVTITLPEFETERD